MRKNKRYGSVPLEDIVANIIIIIILSIFFFPVFSFARHKARSENCISNMRQIGAALMQYAADNDQSLPLKSSRVGNSSISWRRSLSPYIKTKRVFECAENYVGSADDLEKDGYPRSYAVNSTSATLNTSGGPFLGRSKPLKLNEITNPKEVITVVETTAAFCDFNVLNEAVFTKPTNETHNTGHLLAGHRGSTNILFADGHVEQFKPLDTLTSDRNLWSIDGKPFNNTDKIVANKVLQYSVDNNK